MNEVKLNDELFNPIKIWSGEGRAHQFQSVQDMRESEAIYSDSDPRILSVRFRMANQSFFWARKVYNFIDLLAEVGGFSVCMFVLLGFIMNHISYPLQLYDVLRRFFLIESQDTYTSFRPDDDKPEEKNQEA